MRYPMSHQCATDALKMRPQFTPNTSANASLECTQCVPDVSPVRPKCVLDELGEYILGTH